MAEFRARTGRRPNVVVILMDDVGWGDFGCYGGGVAVGAPTPNVDRIARDGLLLTSCYSEPSCTPTRASIMTGRLPMRHGLLVPPMYGMPGGLSGEITLPQFLSDAGYVTQAVGKWHMGENEREPAAERRLRRLLRLLVRIGHVHGMAGSLLLPRDRLQRGPHRVGAQHAVQQVLRARDPQRPARGGRGGHRPRALPAGRQVVHLLRAFIERMAGSTDPWFLYHCTRGAHFDNYPHPDFLGRSPARHPYKDAIVELDDICGRLVAALERTGQLESTMVLISSDNGPEMETWPDSAFTPFRCAKGSTWEGGVRVPAVVSWPGMIEPGRSSDGLVHLLDLFATCLSLAGAVDRMPDRPLHRRGRSAVLPPRGRRCEAVSNRKYQHYWLTSQFSAAPRRRVQVHAVVHLR